jgi:hypothetical protein
MSKDRTFVKVLSRQGESLEVFFIKQQRSLSVLLLLF